MGVLKAHIVPFRSRRAAVRDRLRISTKLLSLKWKFLFRHILKGSLVHFIPYSLT